MALTGMVRGASEVTTKKSALRSSLCPGRGARLQCAPRLFDSNERSIYNAAPVDKCEIRAARARCAPHEVWLCGWYGQGLALRAHAPLDHLPSQQLRPSQRMRQHRPRSPRPRMHAASARHLRRSGGSCPEKSIAARGGVQTDPSVVRSAHVACVVMQARACGEAKAYLPELLQAARAGTAHFLGDARVAEAQHCNGADRALDV